MCKCIYYQDSSVNLFFANFWTSEFRILLLSKTKVHMYIFAKSLSVMTFEEFCAFIKLFSIFNAYIWSQTTTHIYDHLPIWRKLCRLRTVVWDKDAYPAIHNVKSCQVMVFLPVLFSCDPEDYLYVIFDDSCSMKVASLSIKYIPTRGL